MGLFDKLLKKKEPKAQEFHKISIGKENISKMMKRLMDESASPVIKISAMPGNTSLTDSKFGGYPYWDNTKEYPSNKKGTPLCLLAQINLSKLQDSELPDKGLLQFYIDTDDLYGFSFSGEKSGYKVVYFSEFTEGFTVEKLISMGVMSLGDVNGNNVYTPLAKEYCLTFETGIDYPMDFGEDILCNKIKEMFGIEIEPHSLYRSLDKEDYDAIYEATSSYCQGHKMLGHPFFTQSDPRHEDEYQILLLQIDTDYSEERGTDIMWGDSGVANFFISQEDLESLNFDNVLYNWDCY